MANFTGNTFGNFKRAATLLRSGVKGMASKTFWGFFGFGVGAELQDASHALAHIASQGLISAAVFILKNPGGIFVLQNAAAGNRFDAAVAAGGGAGTGSNVFDGFRRVGGKGCACKREQAGRHKERGPLRMGIVANRHSERAKSSFRL